jgi:hypothetical protein
METMDKKATPLAAPEQTGWRTSIVLKRYEAHHAAFVLSDGLRAKIAPVVLTGRAH